jgi:hypothetical protein
LDVRSDVARTALIGQIHGSSVAAHRWLRQRRSRSSGRAASGRRDASRPDPAGRHTCSADNDAPRAEACRHARNTSEAAHRGRRPRRLWWPHRLRPRQTPLTLDLNALEAQLRATKAIGLFTKMSLKNKVDDLMQQFREHYEGNAMTDLRRSYDLLIMKVLSLLQDDDQPLASAIVASREAIWGLLSDQNKFANL